MGATAPVRAGSARRGVFGRSTPQAKGGALLRFFPMQRCGLRCAAMHAVAGAVSARGAPDTSWADGTIQNAFTLAKAHRPDEGPQRRAMLPDAAPSFPRGRRGFAHEREGPTDGGSVRATLGPPLMEADLGRHAQRVAR